MKNSTNMVYNEILEVLKHVSKDEFEKIPKEEIEYYEQKKDKLYNYTFNPENTEISNNACAMIVKLYLKYIASDEEKTEIIGELKKNSELVEQEKNKPFNQDELFKKQNDKINDIQNENTQLVQNVYSKWYRKVWNIIKSLFKKKIERI